MLKLFRFYFCKIIFFIDNFFGNSIFVTKDIPYVCIHRIFEYIFSLIIHHVESYKDLQFLFCVTFKSQKRVALILTKRDQLYWSFSISTVRKKNACITKTSQKGISIEILHCYVLKYIDNRLKCIWKSLIAFYNINAMNWTY